MGISRSNQKIFGVNSPTDDIAVIGSSTNGIKEVTRDLETIQSGEGYSTGWRNLTAGNTLLPTLADFNSLGFLTTSQISYLHQSGVSEYHAEQSYNTNDVTREAGTTNLYSSLTDTNVGNDLTDTANWTLLGDLTNLTSQSNILPIPATLSNGVDSEHDIDCSVGTIQVRDTDGDNPERIAIPATTLQLDSATFRDNNIATISPNTIYGVWAFLLSDGSVVLRFSTNLTNPTITNWTKRGYLGFVITNASSNILRFNQSDKFFQLDNRIAFPRIDNPSTNTGTINTRLPAIDNIVGYFQASLRENDPSVSLFYFSLGKVGSLGVIPGESNSDMYIYGGASTDFVSGNMSKFISLDNGQIDYRTSFSSTVTRIYISTIGWIDNNINY